MSRGTGRTPGILDLDRLWAERHGFYLAETLVAFVSRWNSRTEEWLHIDPLPLVSRWREDYLRQVDDFLAQAATAGFAGVFDEEWAESLRCKIRDWLGTEPFEASEQVAFIQALHDDRKRGGFFVKLSAKIARIQGSLPVGQNGRVMRIVRRRLALAAAHNPISVLFELNVLATLLDTGSTIEALEPTLDDGKKLEALLSFGETRLYIECTVKTQVGYRVDDSGVCLIDSVADARNVANSIIEEKLKRQLLRADLPVLLFVALSTRHDHGTMPFLLRDAVFNDASANVLGGLIVCDSHRAEKRVVYPGPSQVPPLELLERIPTHRAPQGWKDTSWPTSTGASE